MQGIIDKSEVIHFGHKKQNVVNEGNGNMVENQPYCIEQSIPAPTPLYFYITATFLRKYNCIALRIITM